MLRALYRTQTADKKSLTLRALEDEASRAAGKPVDEFSKHYVTGLDALDLKACAADQGLIARVHNDDLFLTRR